MKNKICLFAFLIASNFASGQTLPNFEELQLANPADYKAAEPIVLQSSNYLLSNPVDEAQLDRLYAPMFQPR